ncbi:hypothetical protein [Scytonema hofmannii]|nr:hypothetical protein [Scytonema hofmannii]
MKPLQTGIHQSNSCDRYPQRSSQTPIISFHQRRKISSYVRIDKGA